MYREGKVHPDMTFPVDVGAKYRVSEESKGGIRFRRFDPFDPSASRFFLAPVFSERKA
jgi:hypothetical protein